MSESISSSVEKTIINAQTVIKGEICFAGPAVICGRVEGQIRSEDQLEITAEGTVEGDIIGAIVDIQGTVQGNVTASKTTRLGANAKLIGELRAANLAIAEGATFVGKVCVGGEVPAAMTPEPRGALSSKADATAALQSRLASMQEASKEESAEQEEENDLRVMPQAIQGTLKRASIIKAAAH